MFLPALLELKKPRDAGPRRIMEEVVIGQYVERIGSMGVEFKVDRNIVKKVSEIISVLPNLEG